MEKCPIKFFEMLTVISKGEIYTSVRSIIPIKLI